MIANCHLDEENNKNFNFLRFAYKENKKYGELITLYASLFSVFLPEKTSTFTKH